MKDKEDNILQSRDTELTQASEWLAKLVSGTLTEEDEAKLQYWLSESPSRAETLLEVSDTWDELSDLSQLSELLPLDNNNSPKESETSINNWFPKLPVFSGVSIMLMLALAFSFITLNNEPQGNPLVLMSEVGKQKTFTLPDGTLATLNTNSEIKVLFDKSSSIREVILSRGEAHFDIETDLNRPFIVIAGNKRVRAVGTAFNLFLQSNSLEVIVTEGIVEVSVEHLVNINTSNSKKTNEMVISKTTLSKGHITVVEDDIGTINVINDKTIDKKLLWQQGKLYFIGDPLNEVIATISRYTNLEFVFLDEKSKMVSIGGLYSAENIEGLLATLENNFNIKIKKNDSNIMHISYKNKLHSQPY